MPWKVAALVVGVVLFVTAGVWALRLGGASWSELENASGFLVNIALLAGAVAAIVKFQLYNLLGYRWHSDFKCGHHTTPDGQIILWIDYTLTNTGQRPIRFTEVHIELYPATSNGVLLVPDKDRLLASRVMIPTDTTLKGMFQLEPGERSIYTLRCMLPSLEPAVFAICGFELRHRRVPAAFVGFYVRDAVPKVDAHASYASRRVETDHAAKLELP